MRLSSLQASVKKLKTRAVKITTGKTQAEASLKTTNSRSGVRAIALDTLIRIEDGERAKAAMSNALLQLDERDKRLLIELVYGVLRMRGFLDFVIDSHLKKPGKTLPLPLRNILRLGLYQILKMEKIPPWAAVSETVELVKATGLKGKGGLVNAILREVIRKKEAIELPSIEKDPIRHISIAASHPSWLIRRWVTRFGMADAIALAKANNEIPPLVLRANTLRITRHGLIDLLRERGIYARPTDYSADGIVISGDYSFLSIPDDLSGLLIAQDEVAQLCSHALNPRHRERVLDACAAPGGKTTHIAQMMGDSGEIIAVDKDRERLVLLEDNIKRLGISSIRIIHGDLLAHLNLGLFDRILLDAPCSAIGVIRRNPDIRWKRNEKDLKRFHDLQLRLLKAVAGYLKIGGILVYSVCSTEPEEGEDVIAEFLRQQNNLIIDDIPLSKGFKRFSQGRYMRTYPHRDNMDGFFIARLCRVS